MGGGGIPAPSPRRRRRRPPGNVPESTGEDDARVLARVARADAVARFRLKLGDALAEDRAGENRWPSWFARSVSAPALWSCPRVSLGHRPLRGVDLREHVVQGRSDLDDVALLARVRRSFCATGPATLVERPCSRNRSPPWISCAVVIPTLPEKLMDVAPRQALLRRPLGVVLEIRAHRPALLALRTTSPSTELAYANAPLRSQEENGLVILTASSRCVKRDKT